MRTLRNGRKTPHTTIPDHGVGHTIGDDGGGTVDAFFSDWPPGDDRCAATLRQAMPQGSFIQSVSHAIHSMTLDDLRRYFDPDATAINFVPTIYFAPR